MTTPFGAKLRRMRAERGIAQKDMAQALDVSSAYLSALEHGKRGKPTWFLVQRIITYFNVIWDEAEELQRLAENSDPKITIVTTGLAPEATDFTNRLAHEISHLSVEDFKTLKDEMVKRALKNKAQKKGAQ